MDFKTEEMRIGMRRREREVTDETMIRDVLDRAKYLHLGMSDDGQPYVVPMNYGYRLQDGVLTIYLHGAVEGYKYEVLKKNPRISFTLECDTQPFEGRLACQYGMTYFCIMGKGTAVLVDDIKEKEEALSLLMKTQTGGAFEFDEKMVSIVNVIRLDITEFTAKRRPLPGEEQKQ